MIVARHPKRHLIEVANKRVWFQEPTRSRNGEGGFTTTWSNYIQRWAAILPIRAAQVFEYRSINVEATHYVKTRGCLYSPDNATKVVTEDYRILYGTRTFEILTIEDIQEKQFTKFITCKERRD